jgi:G:T-mismatch repair DNA endonuclease (very short patch repair protein)
MHKYNRWTNEEIEFIKSEYKKGFTKKEVYLKYLDVFGNIRTESSIIQEIKRMKIDVDEELLKRKRSLANTGEKNGMLGKVGPNKGLTKDNSERMRVASKKMSSTRKKLYKEGVLDVSGEKNGMWGKKSWNSGLDKNQDPRISWGEKSSLHAKEKWKNLSQEEKDERIFILNKSNKLKKKDTKIEIKMELLLTELGINFIKQHQVKNWVFDFYLPEINLVIECQGDYWHANPDIFDPNNLNEMQIKNIERDERKRKYLSENNINHLFFWENVIIKNIESVKMTIVSYINILKPTMEK